MNRNRLLVSAAMLFATLLPAGAYAQTHSANLAVSATVSANCRLTGGTLAFGAYDPVVTNAAADLTGSGAFTVACTRGATNVWIGMGLGVNASGSTRRMRLAATTDYLSYELYKDNTASPAVWGNAQASGLAYTPTSKTPYTMTVYGRVPSNQDVPSGSYTDTVVMTVNF